MARLNINGYGKFGVTCGGFVKKAVDFEGA
jgi:hypothetical protein